MNIEQIKNYGLLSILSILFLSCSNDDSSIEAIALNIADLEVLENCAQEIQNVEGANFCSVIPNKVIKNGLYIGGVKYYTNKGSGPYEPSGMTYKWVTVGEGIIIISGANEEVIKLEFNDDFVSGVIKSKIFSNDGSELGSAVETVSLNE